MNKSHGLFFGIIFCSLFATVSTASAQAATEVNYPTVPQALILSIAGNHYPEITRALATIGFQVQEASAEDYAAPRSTRPALLIVPEKEGQRLAPTLVEGITRDVEAGMCLVLDGPSPLAETLGVKATGARATMNRYRWDHYAEDPVLLPQAMTYPRIQAAPALQVLALDAKHDSPLVVSGSRGNGFFIFSAIPLEPQHGMVFRYLPFLAQAIVDQFHLTPSLGADNLCVYVDVGGEPKDDPVALVAQLKSWSVREVHLAAFYGSKAFLDYVPRFLAAAHREGITVYAWLEYPMVSRDFWNQHPEWREVTGNRQPAIMDWRYHMALEDPACFHAVAELTRRLVLDYDWDGVDFAELYFEGDPGIFKDPDDFTPLHHTFRQMFQKRYGVDPLKMFDPNAPEYGLNNPKLREDLKGFRVELITRLTEQFLETLAGCKGQKPYLQTTLTVIDTLRDPSVTERFGVDPDRLLALQKRFGFDVEIEDPYTVWNSSPDRYRAIGEHYRPRVLPGTPFSLDVNVVDREPPGRPLNTPRGLELYALLANVVPNVDLITLYAYSTFSRDDMRLVPFVLGAPQMTGGIGEDGTINAQRQLFWRTDTRGRSVYLDGKEWPCWSDSEVLIPAGVHKVSTAPQASGAAQDTLRIEYLSGAILSAEQSGGHIRLTYESRGRCYALLNRAPATVLCDGAPGGVEVLNNGGRVCLALPQGKHTLDLE